jgi:hypothetical protein
LQKCSNAISLPVELHPDGEYAPSRLGYYPAG